MQFFVSNVIWDEDKIMSKYRSMVEEDLGDPDGTLIFDESGFPNDMYVGAFFPLAHQAQIGKKSTSSYAVAA